jgi:pimeloyl-ACP methyl ester carboxylesterase
MKYVNKKKMRGLVLIALAVLVLQGVSGCRSLYSMHLKYNVEVAPERFEINEGGERVKLAMKASRPLSENSSKVDTLIVVIHGGGLNAVKSCGTGLLLAEAMKLNKDRVMVAAPQFVMDQMEQEEKGLLFWDQHWRGGGNSLSKDQNQGLPSLNSFTVLDRLLEAAADGRPNLKRVVILGHSAGGQYVIRYAAINGVHQKLQAKGVSLQYLVANPSSYLYLSPARYRFDQNGGFMQVAVKDLAGCPEYNGYKYGMDKRFGYAKDLSAQAIQTRLLSRPIIFALGKEDTKRNWSLDDTCMGDAQGLNRYERGLLYKHHLQVMNSGKAPERHTWLEVPGVGHDAKAIYTHPLVINRLSKTQP